MKKTYLVAAAVSGMIAAAGCTSTQTAGDASLGQCHGINACKGEGDCGGKNHGCAGKNSCKGKGWKKMSQEDCDAKGGTFKS